MPKQAFFVSCFLAFLFGLGLWMGHGHEGAYIHKNAPQNLGLFSM
jgi:hypothetical protein